MKQPNSIRLKYKTLLAHKRGMTENSKNLCHLLFSVILLTGTITGIAEPLNHEMLRIAEKTKYTEKEISLYQEFMQRPDRSRLYRQNQKAMEELRRKLPENLNADEVAGQFYRLAGKYGVTVRLMKQVKSMNNTDDITGRNGKPGMTKRQTRTGGQDKTGAGCDPDTVGKEAGSLAWETEFTGNWHTLPGFMQELEEREPLTRLRIVQIKRKQDMEIWVRASLNTYYYSGK